MRDAIRRFWERGRKGYCYEDIWSFDYWLSGTIARGLKEFKSGCHSYPNDLDDWDKWMARLDEMIDCFEEQTRNIENREGVDAEKWHKRREYQKQKLHRGLELLEKYYYDLWD